MTLLFMEGFDHYNTYQQFVDKWDNVYCITSPSPTYARFDGEGIYFSNLANVLTKILDNTYTTIYIGAAYKITHTGNPVLNAGYPFIEVKDEEDTAQVGIYIDSAYAIHAYRRDGTYLGKSSDYVMQNSRYHYIELKVVISDTVGEVVVRVDETVVLNLTSQDTRNGTAYIDRVSFHSISSEWDCHVDDIYIDDAGFLGNCHIKTFFPDSDGNSADFTRSTGSNDYECVDEQGSNEDTDYIYSDTLNHKSIFGITTGALGTVKGIQLNNHCRIDQAGTRKITPIIRSNSTDYSGTEGAALPSDYIYEHEIFETDPDDSNPWTQTKLEAAEFGLEITT